MVSKVIKEHLECLSFIYKDDDITNIHNEINYSLSEAQKRIDAIEKTNQKQLSFKIGREEHFINFNKLLYIKVSDVIHRLVVVAKDEQSEFYGTISEISKRYPELLQVDRSCMVNPQNIVSFDSKQRKIFFENGISVDVSRRNAKNVKKTMEKHCNDIQ